jgi:hypothetical protein
MITPKQQSFTEKFDEQVSRLEDFGNWNKQCLREVYGTKRNPGLIDQVKEAVAEFEFEDIDFPSLYKVCSDVSSSIETLRDDLQEKHDNTPESLQNTETYYNREEALDLLIDIYESMEELLGDDELKPEGTVVAEKKKVDDDCGLRELAIKKLAKLDHDYVALGIWSFDEYTALREKFLEIING